MDNRYFATARHDVLAHVPGAPKRILDIGCGWGSTTDALRKRGGVEFAIGVEIDPASAKEAEKHFDHVYCNAVEDAPFEERIAPGTLDAVLCLDVLEHLVDPWTVVQRVTPLLAPGGRLYVSVPNIRNWKFIWRLLTRGDFHYTQSGLLDRTHLRFFVRETAMALAGAGGLDVVACVDARAYKSYEARAILNALTFGGTSGLIAKQWIAIAERRA